jgi:predicted SAM-dependent methyltransferase
MELYLYPPIRPDGVMLKHQTLKFCVLLPLLFRVLNINFNIILQSMPKTEFRGQVFNTPASYSGGPGFNSRPDTRIYKLRFFMVLLIPSR